MLFELEMENKTYARMRVVGIGGAGGNAVNRMIEAGLSGVDFVSINTDAQALDNSRASQRIQIGSRVTKGLGAGSDPILGRRAIEEDRDLVAENLVGADMVFVTCGMGGGTGTGAAPVIAETAKEQGALTIAVVTRPFDFEGKKRMYKALTGIDELKDKVDTLIVIPNQRLLNVVDKDTKLTDAFKLADDVLLQATKGISDLIMVPGLINLDFADVRAVMSEMGDAIFGTGQSNGENRASDAAHKAIDSPLLEDLSISGAKGVLINVTGGADLTLHEVSDAAQVVVDAAGTDANIIFGAVIDQALKDEIRVTVIATGFGERLHSSRLEGEEERFGDLFSSRRLTLENHAFSRKNQNNQKSVAQKTKVQSFAQDDLEIPTFLRRKAED